MLHWFKVTFDKTTIKIKVSAPGQKVVNDTILWTDIKRICRIARSMLESDELYIYTDKFPDGLLIPTEAVGGRDLWDEMITRGAFDADVAINAAMGKDNERFCWPPEK
jgi:hypothetical protein